VPFNLAHMCKGLVTCDLIPFNILLTFQNKTSMKKKKYERPTTQVFKLQHTGMLMTSGDEVLRSDYGDPIVDTWEE